MKTIVHGGPILDVESGTFHHDAALVIADGVIESFQTHFTVPYSSDHSLIDVRGGHVIPGLIDSHFHLMSRSGVVADADLVTRSVVDGVITARRAVESGVTTVRDPGCKHRGIHRLRDEIADGRVIGPRAYTAGPNIVGSGAPVDWRNHFANGADQVCAAVREELLAGADFIKLVLSHTTGSSRWATCLRYLNDEEIAVAVAEAHLLDARVGCHCEGLAAARAAVAAGVDVIDHGLALDDALVVRMADQGTFYVPTLWAFRTNTHLHVGKTITADQSADYEDRIARVHRESVQRAMAAGVKIAAGSDPIHWIPARDVLLCELEALVDAGMSTIDAIRAATVVAADAIGRPGIVGTLRRGAHADLVVVDGDPLTELRVLGRPLLVVKGGTTLVDHRTESTQRAALWDDIASGSPASARQPEIWLSRD
ncbi:amidohydrolase family protein [Gordonia sp. NPDC003376]